VNRIVPAGEERAAAEKLAAQLAQLPQTCMRQDRLSVREQWSLDEEAALAGELRHGYTSLSDGALAGAARFTAGAGRHGE
jgi:enoyl-CoA hydratase